MRWSFMTEMFAKSIYPLANLVLARILVPEDFGLFAMAAAVTGLGQLFGDFGLGRALIQTEADGKRSANIVFWANTIFSIGLYVIIFFIAPFAASFFREVAIVPLIRVLSFQIILTALGSAQFSFLQREFKFKSIFFCGLGLAFFSATISIWLAFLGYGVFALVIGTLSGSMAQTILLWKVISWHPDFSFDIALAKKLFYFGGWLMIESLLVWIMVRGEIIVIGRFLGLRDTGIYSFAATLTALIFGTIFNPMLSILYSSFSRLKSQVYELPSSFLKISKITSYMALPIAVGLALTASPFTAVILGPKWQGIEKIIFLLSFAYGVSWMVGINNGLYRAMGKPEVNSKIMVLSLLIYLPVYVFAAAKGIIVFCAAKILLEIIHAVIQSFWVHNLLKINLFYLLDRAKIAFLSVVIMGGIVYYAIGLIGPFQGYFGLLKLLILILLGVISYGFGLYLLDRIFLKQFLRLIKKSLGGRIRTPHHLEKSKNEMSSQDF